MLNNIFFFPGFMSMMRANEIYQEKKLNSEMYRTSMQILTEEEEFEDFRKNLDQEAKINIWKKYGQRFLDKLKDSSEIDAKYVEYIKLA